MHDTSRQRVGHFRLLHADDARALDHVVCGQNQAVAVDQHAAAVAHHGHRDRAFAPVLARHTLGVDRPLDYKNPHRRLVDGPVGEGLSGGSEGDAPETREPCGQGYGKASMLLRCMMAHLETPIAASAL